MTVDIRLTHEFREDGHYFRAVQLRVGTDKTFDLLPSWDDKVRLPSKIPNWWTPFTEVYARVTLSELREAREDAARQGALLRRHFAPHSENTGLTITKVLVRPDEKVSEKDVDYLAHLFPLPGSVMPVVPLLYRYNLGPSGRVHELKPVDPATYLSFAKHFTQTLRGEGVKEFAIAVPSNFAFSNIAPLLQLHKDDSTPLVVIDCNGRGTEDLISQIRTIVGAKKDGNPSLVQKHGSKFALYAFDMKPFRGRSDVVPALNLLHLDGGFSSFGRRHTIKMGGEDGSKPRSPPRPDQRRIIFPAKLAYARANVPEAVDGLKSWHKDNRSPPHDMLETVLQTSREYEQEHLVGVARKMTEWAKSNELHHVLDGHEHLRDEVRRLRKRNAQLLSTGTQTTLL